MLNEKRIKLMTQMAMYETKQGQKDFKISSYYQKDYASLNTWITAVWSTIGYAAVAVSVLLLFLDDIFSETSLARLLIVAGIVIGGYIVTVVVSAIIAHDFYRRKHTEARKRVKKFNHDLTRLGKMYEKEIR